MLDFVVNTCSLFHVRRYFILLQNWLLVMVCHFLNTGISIFLFLLVPYLPQSLGEIETLKHMIVHCHRNNQDSIYEFFSLRILAGEKHPQIRLQHLIRKVWIWVVCTSNQPFKTDSYNERKFLKKWSSYWKNPVVCDRSILYSPFYFSYTGF